MSIPTDPTHEATTSVEFRFSDGDDPGALMASTVKTSRKFAMPDEVNAFRDECFSVAAWSAERMPGLGSLWIDASIGISRMNYIFPNQPHNCANGSGFTDALYAPSSFHSGGNYGSLADGSVRLIARTVEVPIWQAIGTRNGGETIVLHE